MNKDRSATCKHAQVKSHASFVLGLTASSSFVLLAAATTSCWVQTTVKCCSVSAPRPTIDCTGLTCQAPITANPTINDLASAAAGKPGKNDYTQGAVTNCLWLTPNCNGVDCGNGTTPGGSDTCYNYSPSGSNCTGT